MPRVERALTQFTLSGQKAVMRNDLTICGGRCARGAPQRRSHFDFSDLLSASETQHSSQTEWASNSRRRGSRPTSFPWRPEERDSSLGGRYFNAKRDPSSFHRDLLKNSARLGQPEPPTVASNEATGAVSPEITF